MTEAKHLGYDHKMFSVLPYNSQMRDLRKICTMKLFTASRIGSFKHLRTEEVSALICSLFESCQREAAPVNMKSRLSDLTSNIIMRMVASKRVSGSQCSKDLQEGHQLKKMVEETFYLYGVFAVGDYLPFLKWLDLQGLISAMKKLQKKRDSFMQKLVDEHQHDNRMYRHILCDHRMGTGGSIAAPQHFAKSPGGARQTCRKDRLVEESDLHELSYLNAIVKETLRLYPAGPLLVPHEAAEACTIGGFHVAAGTRLLDNAWAIHRDADVWSSPTEFDPKRFLKGGKVIDVKGHDFELIPFGSGRRMCPGMSLAFVVVHNTLARLLQSFEWCVPEGTVIEMSEGLGLTMPKVVPLEATIKPRLPVHLY
ncbi:hypothetical protein SUGI_0546090 [Cryptomeria japonica]|nr:hypothetical protein SUGI_0546090 [Cryptomeria japonica]